MAYYLFHVNLGMGFPLETQHFRQKLAPARIKKNCYFIWNRCYFAVWSI